jgi:hypothetical protein
MAARKAIQTIEKAAMQNEEDAPAQSFADVARKITGGDAPAWLVDTLKNWAPCLAIDRGVAFRQPGRSEMKKKLQGVGSAAELIVSALHDGATRGFLDAATPGGIPYRGQIDHMLRDLVRRAEDGIESLSTADGKTKAGRNKAVPPGSFHPKTLCAALILEAWTFVHEVEPAPKNQEAAAAADLFWNASMEDLGIEPAKERIEKTVTKEAKSWGERLNGWRHHFKQAKEPAVSNNRQEIRRYLKEGKHSARILGGDKSA